MGAVAVGFVRDDRRGLAGQGRGAAAGRVDTFLLLPPVAEPNPDHLLLHVQLLGHQQDLLRRGLLVLTGNKNKTNQIKFCSFSHPYIKQYVSLDGPN